MKAIHFSIDVQFWYRDDLGAATWDHLINKGRTLEEELKKRGIFTVHVLQSYHFVPHSQGIGALAYSPQENLRFLENSPEANSAIPLTPNHLTAFKSRWALGDNQGIEGFLEKNDFDTIILSGLYEADSDASLRQGNFCVSESARGLSKSYNVIIAADATDCSRKLPLRKRRELHPFADIQQTSSVLRAIDASSRSKEYSAPRRSGRHPSSPKISQAKKATR